MAGTSQNLRLNNNFLWYHIVYLIIFEWFMLKLVEKRVLTILEQAFHFLLGGFAVRVF